MPVTVINMIPNSLSGETNRDSEPNVSVNPANPLQIAASAFTPDPRELRDRADLRLHRRRQHLDAERRPARRQSDRRHVAALRDHVRTSLRRHPALRQLEHEHPAQGELHRPGRDDRAGQSRQRGPAVGRGSHELGGAGASAGQGVCRATTISTRPRAGLHRSSSLSTPRPRPRRPASRPRASMCARPAARMARRSATRGIRTAPSMAYSWAGGLGSRRHITAMSWSSGTTTGAQAQRRSGSPRRRRRPGRRQGRHGRDPAALRSIAGDAAHRLVGCHRCRPAQQPHGLPGVDRRRLGGSARPSTFAAPTDRGQTWSADLRTIATATNPCLAINVQGKVGFMYQQLGNPGSGNRWRTHLELSSDGFATPPTDLLLADVPDSNGSLRRREPDRRLCERHRGRQELLRRFQRQQHAGERQLPQWRHLSAQRQLHDQYAAGQRRRDTGRRLHRPVLRALLGPGRRPPTITCATGRTVRPSTTPASNRRRIRSSTPRATCGTSAAMLRRPSSPISRRTRIPQNDATNFAFARISRNAAGSPRRSMSSFWWRNSAPAAPMRASPRRRSVSPPPKRARSHRPHGCSARHRRRICAWRSRYRPQATRSSRPGWSARHRAGPRPI